MKDIYIQLRWNIPLWIILLLTNWWPDNRYTITLRGFLVKPFIKKVGKNFQISSGVTILNTYNLIVGDNVYIAKGCWLNCMGGLEIEDEVILAPYVVISTMQHVFKNNSVRFGGSIPGKVKIGKGSWIAAHASIKCGVEIGKGNIVASNASIVKDTPDFVIVGGVPGKVISNNKNSEMGTFSRSELLAKGRYS